MRNVGDFQQFLTIFGYFGRFLMWQFFSIVMAGRHLKNQAILPTEIKMLNVLTYSLTKSKSASRLSYRVYIYRVRPNLTITFFVNTCVQLFDYVADCIADFFTKHAQDQAERRANIPLGFTFSFPLTQSSLHSGVLIKWTKAFEASGVIGNDVVQMLRQAILKKNVRYQFFISLKSSI